ncbi:hypothetical protein FRB99_002710, partial [Tulasnella sp. 403]
MAILPQPSTVYVTPDSEGPTSVWIEGIEAAWVVTNTRSTPPNFASGDTLQLTISNAVPPEVVDQHYFQFWQQQAGFTDWGVGWNSEEFPKNNPSNNEYLGIVTRPPPGSPFLRRDPFSTISS